MRLLQIERAIGEGVADFLPVPVEAAVSAASAVIFFVVVLALIVLGRAVVLPVCGRLMNQRGLDAHARRPIQKVVWLVTLFAAVAIAFGVAGYGNFLSSLAVIAAAATLAIGFAMQDVLKNFVSGVFIFTEQPFRIGDWIEWDDHAGVVEDISLRVTRVRTFDNELLTVPNSDLTNDVVKNPVAKDTLRMKFTFGIGYDDDVDRARNIVLDEAERHEDILGDPAPSVRLTELGDSSVALQSRVWISDPSRADFVRTQGEYVEAVKERFDDAGIDIPYPNRELSGELSVADATVATGDL